MQLHGEGITKPCSLFPRQRIELRKGNVPQGLNHQEWFGVAIQLPGNQPISGLLRRKADPSKKLSTSNKLNKTTSKPDQLITQQTILLTHPRRARAGDKGGERQRERKKHIPAGDPKQCGEAKGDETGGGDDDDDDAQMKAQRIKHMRAHESRRNTYQSTHMEAHIGNQTYASTQMRAHI